MPASMALSALVPREVVFRRRGTVGAVGGGSSLTALTGVFGDFGFNTTRVVFEFVFPGNGAASTSMTGPGAGDCGGGTNFVAGLSRYA